jgi:hypothetical protein
MKKVKIIFLWNPTLDEDGFSTYMDLDTTFGAAIRSACKTLGWRLSDWDFFFGPIELGLDDRVDLDRVLTPRMCDLDATDEVEILCKPARDNV